MMVIKALRELNYRPKAVYGCEVWRNLDWLNDKDKIIFNVSGNKKLEEDLLKVFDSQITGGKLYDKATIGRRLSNATFSETTEIDSAESMIYAMDLTPLIYDHTININSFIKEHIYNFSNDVDLLISDLNT